MLDNDLAELYDVPTKVFNQAVKRNKSRFPSDFMFQLTKFDNLRSQIVTLETGRDAIENISVIVQGDRHFDVSRILETWRYHECACLLCEHRLMLLFPQTLYV